jgi:Fe-S-cluster-containing dehydrogenase component
VAATPANGRDEDVFEFAFRAEPLRSLDARGRASVRASATLRHVEAGAVVVHAGAPADTLVVVVRGAISVEDPSAPHGPGREVRAGQAFGHEAFVPFASRRVRGVASERASVLELPVAVLCRALVRAGLSEVVVREETRARRSEWRALLAGTAFGALPPAELHALVSTLVEFSCQSGDRLGEAARSSGVFVVAGGLFALASAVPGETPSYAARGDVAGLAPDPRTEAPFAVALGSALALGVPREALERIALRHPDVLVRLESVARARAAKQRRSLPAAPRAATRHARDDMARLGSASSLLAIDLDRCTRCGHCTATCAASHGTARLERRGEKLVVTLRNAESVASAALLLPSACQHCHEPACLDPCPTGAIRRLATGAVELDAERCTGCGACAKACPWDAIRMAPRPGGGRAADGPSATVAVKCDLCRGLDGPECVSACPTDAIFRLDPARDVVEVRAAVGKKDGAKRVRAATRLLPARVVMALALVPPLVALDRSLPGGGGQGARLVAGVLAAALVVGLAGQAAIKRVPSVRHRARRVLSRSSDVSTVSPFVALHATSGWVAFACVFLHAGFSVPEGPLGLLALSFWGVALSGAFGAAVYRALPERLTRLERRSTLPEDEPAQREALLDRLHASVSGANPAQKALVRGFLLPYARSWGGAALLAAGGRALASEEAAVLARIDVVLGGRKSERLAGIRELVLTAVEMRAERARRLLRALLRSWLPLHLALSTLVLVVLALHVAGALG